MNPQTRTVEVGAFKFWIHHFERRLSVDRFDVVALKGALPSDGTLLELCNGTPIQPGVAIGGAVRRESARRARVSLWRH